MHSSESSGESSSVDASATSADVLARLAELDGAEASLVLSSGVAAIICTMLALLRPGDHLVASNWLFGASREFIELELPNVGVEVTLVDPTATRGWRRSNGPRAAC